MKVRYYHDNIGVNSRLDTIQAAILRVKLPHLDEYSNARRGAADFYDKAFAKCDKIITPKRFEKSTHTFHQYTMVLKNVDRKGLQDFLSSKGIASAVYYPVPLHAQKAFQEFKYNPTDFPITDQLCETVFSLPMNTELDENSLSYICDSVLEYLK
jgi:dTDP-4-amino-4,6-dideoxygalactose transaminase